MPVLRAMAAGLGAAALAYGLNWLVLRRLGGRALWLAVPAVEETLKSGTALLLQASLPAAHALFGLVEAGYELRAPRPSPPAAILALGTHCLFGLLTAWLAARSGSPGPAVLSVTAFHAMFNLVVVRAPARSSEASR